MQKRTLTLASGPQSFLDRYLTDEGLFKFDSLGDVWDILDISYKNLNEEEEAREEMNNLRQANLPLVGTWQNSNFCITYLI